MKKIIAFFLLFLLLIPTSFAADPWDKEQIILESTYMLALVADWSQTLYISEHEEFVETNPILGRRPDRGEVNAYFALSALTHFAVSYFLPSRYRDFWISYWLGYEIAFVQRNASIGVGFSF